MCGTVMSNILKQKLKMYFRLLARSLIGRFIHDDLNELTYNYEIFRECVYPNPGEIGQVRNRT